MSKIKTSFLNSRFAHFAEKSTDPPDNEYTRAVQAALREAITEFQVYDDESLHTFDENGVPCQFFKDRTRR